MSTTQQSIAFAKCTFLSSSRIDKSCPPQSRIISAKLHPILLSKPSTVGIGATSISAKNVITSRLGSSQSNVLERPGLDRSYGSDSAPLTEEGGERGKLKQRLRNGGGDRYKVLLLDHERHTESLIVKVLPKVVPSLTADDARRVFKDSKDLGVGLVTVAIKEHAEFYAQMIARNGVRSTIEPDGVLL